MLTILIGQICEFIDVVLVDVITILIACTTIFITIVLILFISQMCTFIIIVLTDIIIILVDHTLIFIIIALDVLINYTVILTLQMI